MSNTTEQRDEQTTTIEQDQRTRITSLPWPIRRERLRQMQQADAGGELDEG
jgi:hypothetical protein